MSILLLGVDIGTTSTKAALFDLADPARPIQSHIAPRAPPRRNRAASETDPLAVRDRVAQCIARS